MLMRTKAIGKMNLGNGEAPIPHGWLSMHLSDKAGKDVILDVDVQGAAQLRQQYPEGVFVFMLPPSWDMLEERLRARRSDAPEEIEWRLKKAREEIKCFSEYKYVIINDVLERMVGDLCAIIAGERCRSFRLNPQVREDLGI
jgi:guanylate kinase